jgi:O-antigen/teichoic acid export membrane protein
LFGYFGIFDFGLGQGLVKFVSEYNAKGEHRKMSLAINSCLLFQIGVVAVLGTGLYFLAGNIVQLFNVSPENFVSSKQAFQLSLLGLLISFISATFSSVLMGIQRYDLTSSVDSLSNLFLNVSLVIALFFLPLRLWQAVALSVLFTFLSLIAYLVLMYKKAPFYTFRIEYSGTIVKQFIRYSINIFLSKVSALFSTYLVRFILAYFLTPAAVTLYVVPNKLIGAVGGMLSSGANTIFPFVSSLHAKNEMASIRSSFQKAAAVFAALSIPVFLFLSLFAYEILSVWMGSSFAEKTWLLLSIVSLSSLIGSASTLPNLLILGMGNSRLIAFFSFLSIGLYIIFLPVLTAKFGLEGSAAALLINTVVTISFVFKYNLRYIQIPLSVYLKNTYQQHIIPAILFIGLSLAARLFLPHTSSLFSLGLLLLGFYYLYLYRNVYRKFVNKPAEPEALQPAEMAA